MNEIEKVKQYYKKTKIEIDEELKRFNETMIQEKNPYIKDASSEYVEVIK